MDDDDQLNRVFSALSDPVRRGILARLTQGEATVNELAEPFPMSIQAISRHIKVLEQADLITRSRHAQTRPCAINPVTLGHASDWIERHRVMRNEQFDRLAAYFQGTQSTTRGGVTDASDHHGSDAEDRDP